MEKLCKDCKFKMNIQNTAETGQAICTFYDNYFLIDIEAIAYFYPKPT